MDEFTGILNLIGKNGKSLLEKNVEKCLLYIIYGQLTVRNTSGLSNEPNIRLESKSSRILLLTYVEKCDRT